MDQKDKHYCATHQPSNHYLMKRLGDGMELCLKELKYENGKWLCPVHGQKVND